MGGELRSRCLSLPPPLGGTTGLMLDDLEDGRPSAVGAADCLEDDDADEDDRGGGPAGEWTCCVPGLGRPFSCSS